MDPTLQTTPVVFDYSLGGGSPVGLQSDGTNMPSPTAATIPTPADTPGGAPAQYAQPILDIFKFGVGQYAAQQSQQQLFDYKKFEATNGGLFQQGQQATLPKAATGSSMSPFMMLAIAGIVGFALLTHKA